MQADRPVAGVSPTLQTERLILRPTEPQDFDAWAAFAADDEVMARAWAINGFAMFSVIEKTSGMWFGRLPDPVQGERIDVWGRRGSSGGLGDAFRYSGRLPLRLADQN